MRNTILCTLLLAITLGAAEMPRAPQYTKSGELLMPKDYRQWEFLSSSIAMNYPEGGPDGPGGHIMFGNIFVQPEASREFQKTGTWPDKTMMIIELRGTGTDSFVSKQAKFQTGVMGYEFHVKDSARGGWNFYSIEKDADSGKAFNKDAKCFSCHEQHGAADTTFVQYYPTLIEAAKKNGTWKEARK